MSFLVSSEPKFLANIEPLVLSHKWAIRIKGFMNQWATRAYAPVPHQGYVPVGHQLLATGCPNRAVTDITMTLQ